jgi:hypothetical protein
MNNKICTLYYLLQLVSRTKISAGAFNFSFGEKLHLQLMNEMSMLPTVPYYKKKTSIYHLMSGF